MQNPPFSRRCYELLSSMRFAVSLLTVLAIAAVIGTVIKQNDAYNAYLNQFGQFWFPVFESLGLYSVYDTAWFILIMTFLVLSTSACIVRQAPGMLKEMKSFRTSARELSLRQFAHHAVLNTGLARDVALERVTAYLTAQGYASRIKERQGAVLVGAKAGAWSRMGYLFAHGAIVLILLGGLANSDLMLKLQVMGGAKQVTAPDKPFSEIGADSRLGLDHWSYRANVFLPEGKQSAIATINVKDGMLLQDLPFAISLKKFRVEHYSTGMPKYFASDVVLTDRNGTEGMPVTVEMNKPVTFQGVTIYQSGFQDGGTKLGLKVHELQPGSMRNREVATEIGEALKMDGGLRVELMDFRANNVENMADPARKEQEGFWEKLFAAFSGSGARRSGNKEFVNVGPNFSFKVRDPAGQAREYQNYMAPIQQAGRWYFMSGMRTTQAEGFRYMRIPADENMRPDTWWGIRAVLTDPALRTQLAGRFSRAAAHGDAVSETVRTRLAASAELTLASFARGGVESVDAFIKERVPEAERGEAADAFKRVLEGCAWQAWLLLRERERLPALELTPERSEFLLESLDAISDGIHYGAPFYLELASYDEVKASILQVRRSPALGVVYLGCAFLVAGVCFMLYVRERRCFVLIKDSGEVVMALSANRKILEIDAEFDRHRLALAQLLEK